MRSLKRILIASVVVVGVANAGCCLTNCCKTTKCIQKVTKCVPYKVCTTVCVPVKDKCGNITGYKNVQKWTTKYKTVVVDKVVSCCN
jgi:hypothetical protein